MDLTYRKIEKIVQRNPNYLAPRGCRVVLFWRNITSLSKGFQIYCWIGLYLKCSHVTCEKWILRYWNLTSFQSPISFSTGEMPGVCNLRGALRHRPVGGSCKKKHPILAWPSSYSSRILMTNGGSYTSDDCIYSSPHNSKSSENMKKEHGIWDRKTWIWGITSILCWRK